MGGTVVEILQTRGVATTDTINLTGTGALNAAFLRIGAAAQDANANDYLVYHQATGDLLYDADGSGAGAAVLFARLSPGLALTNQDFWVV